VAHHDTETPDLVQRNFRASTPNAVWCADSKQIWTSEGWVHLAAIIDLHSRRIVGYACGKTATAAVAERALASAVQSRCPPEGCVHHSDRGSAYVSETYREALRKMGAKPSLSRPGTPLDNAVIESFFSTLTREFLPGRHFATRVEAEHAIFEFIEVFYNRKRLHSTLDYQSPAGFEAQYFSPQSPQGVSIKTG
jgi:transposase InsO family protein